MIVLDASIVLELLLGRSSAERVEERIADESLVAPELLDLEVAQVVRRYEMRGHVTSVRAAEAIQDYLDLEIERWGHEALLPRVWELRPNFTAYDAAYIALAEALDAVLLTADRALAGASLHAGRVEVID